MRYMFPILKKEKLAENSYLMEVEAPDVAKHAKPGQFIILRIDEYGERIPLTIADISEKTISMIFLVVGKTTEKLSRLRKGDSLLNFVGPLGTPSEIKKYGHVWVKQIESIKKLRFPKWQGYKEAPFEIVKPQFVASFKVYNGNKEDNAAERDNFLEEASIGQGFYVRF